MCGFAGALSVLNMRSVESDKEQLNRALATLVHRGPDGEGKIRRSVGDWEVTVGHRRLKIIDLDDRAAQPFCRDHIIAVFNGELYNYIEIRGDLQREGHGFVTESDTEVVAAAFQHWGSGCFKRFDGMFAIVLIDCLHRKVLFSRDPFGEKPLYLSVGRDRIVFGSSVDSVSALLDGPGRGIDYGWVEAFLHLGFAPAPMTIWNGVEKVAAGETRELDLETGLWTVARAAAHDFIGSGKADAAFDPVEFENLLITSLERRLRADVPIALLLSGGIDSAYIAALMRRKLNRPLAAVTIHDRFDGSEEMLRAARVCKNLGIEHRLLPLPKKSLGDLVGEAVSAMDEPISDPAFPMLVELFAQLPPEYRVVLTGDGADELFLSYGNYRRLLEMRSDFKAKVAGKFAGTAVRIASRIGDAAALRMAKRMVMEADLPIDTRLGLLQSHSCRGAADGMPWFDAIKPKDSGISALWRYSLEHELPEYLLVKADRASMRFSFESRTPYLSSDLFRYVLSCDPGTMRLGDKVHMKRRINELLGEDMMFAKRGFFASGQNHLARSDDWHPLLAEHFKDGLKGVANPRRTDATTYYRFHILNTWLKSKCA